jgi:hypothetical protein
VTPELKTVADEAGERRVACHLYGVPQESAYS